MKEHYDAKEFYRAHLARDARFDGKFFVAVKTTKIYCRPICPARKAKLENIEFFIYAHEAEKVGYRPCLRCRPEAAPGSTAWLGTSAIIQRAMRLMDQLALEELSIKELAERIGIGERWLRELFQQQVGTSPQAILLTKKLDVACKLLEESTLSITDVAFSAGFQSLRRFNDAFKLRFLQTPSALRKNSKATGQLRFQLSYRPPYAWSNMLNFLENRAIPGIEIVENGSYQRLIRQGDVQGWFKLTPGVHNKVDVEFKLNKNANILDLIARVKNIFDLDADPISITKALQEDEKISPYLALYPGLRVPGGWDGFELAVRAVVGQQISVKAARTILGRMVEMCGEGFFPTPRQLLAADLGKIGLPAPRVATLKALATLMVQGGLILDETADYAATCQTLINIKGIGPWTVEYIAMRSLRNPNSFPEKDLVLQKKIAHLQLNPQKWSPWRAYGAILLWNIS